ncbi:MAG: tetratricopeptide repeat protein [Lentisphaerae bacterium]|nr:tetratricopeptide repeat protein [Lentisphaerota bacterium]
MWLALMLGAGAMAVSGVGHGLPGLIFLVLPFGGLFPLIRAKIANEKYDEAVSDLEKLLEKDPGNYHVIALLIDIFVEKTQDYQNAHELIRAYLRKEDRLPQDVSIVMKLVDVYLDNDASEKAVELLNAEVRKKYEPKDLKALELRLGGITRNT